MRILIISQWFDPEPTPKGLAFACALKAAGHDVQVITGFPNYPGGRIYDGYRIKHLQREVLNGISVLRVPIYPSHGHSKMGRVLNYLSFGVSSLLAGLLVARRPDVIYVYHPPLTTPVSAAIISWFRRAPVVCDIQDLWPDTLRATGMIGNERVLQLVGLLAAWIYKRASKIVVLSPGFRQRLLSSGVPSTKVEVIHNWCDEAALKLPENDDRESLGLAGTFNVLFAGTMGRAQALGSVLAAADLVQKQNMSVRFVFVGGGMDVEELKATAATAGLTNVVFLPRMPMQDVGKVIKAADVLLVHLRDDPLFEITIPSKTQAYLFAGKPLLMAVKGDAARLVEDSGAGICVSPEAPADLAAAVLRLASLSKEELKTMGNRGARYYNENLSLVMGTRAFCQVFERAIADNKVPAEA